MQISTIVDAIHECDEEQLALVFEATVQRFGVVGENAVAALMELMSGRPEDGDFVDGLDLLQAFVTGTA
ncbi:MAG: hypothetical protein ACRYG4_04220 [Janthinobacterium lividum]